MIDGVINNGPKQPTVAELERRPRTTSPISLMDLAPPLIGTDAERREKKPSVLEQLKSQPKQEHKKQAPKKSAEKRVEMGKLHL